MKTDEESVFCITSLITWMDNHLSLLDTLSPQHLKDLSQFHVQSMQHTTRRDITILCTWKSLDLWCHQRATHCQAPKRKWGKSVWFSAAYEENLYLKVGDGPDGGMQLISCSTPSKCWTLLMVHLLTFSVCGCHGEFLGVGKDWRASLTSLLFADVVL